MAFLRIMLQPLSGKQAWKNRQKRELLTFFRVSGDSKQK
jgi:hypothetical protein